MSIMDFRELEKVGEGTYGEVYRVSRISDRNIYAMKKVKIMDLKEKDKKNTLNEIRILASIEHPNIVQYRQAFFDNIKNHLCIVMDYASQGDLSHLIKSRFKRGQGFYQYEIWKFGEQMLAGIKHLHSMNIIHRDLKPANIFLGDKNELKIGDLNISRQIRDELACTQTGTPNYASPEIWNNEPYGFECDIWSFGCIIYEMCCFKPPFRGKDMSELYEKIQKGVCDKIPKRYSFIMENAIGSCLKKKSQRICIDELLQIFTKYSSSTSHKHIKKSSSSVLLGTIDFPKDNHQFSQILPSSNYEQKDKTNPQCSIEKGYKQKSAILDRFMKEKTPIAKQISQVNLKLNNKIYYEDQNVELKVIRSQKCLPYNNIKPSSVERNMPKLVQKNVSFKQILQSLEDARIIQKNIQKSNLRRRKLRLANYF